MAFGENSWLPGDNGADMIWNPTSNFADGLGEPIFGGMHYVYVFGVNVDGSGSPAYDSGEWLRDKWKNPSNSGKSDFYDAWRSCFWIFEPFLIPGRQLLETDVKLSMRINIPYQKREVDNSNLSFPKYTFRIDAPTVVGGANTLEDALAMINVVPNPYYAYSTYETSKLDNRVKIVNIPERCEITIFNVRGGLVRSFVKDDPLTSIDWDLKNHRGIPIAGGLYIIHVKVEIEGVEHEKIIKWYGGLRPPDLDNL